MSLLVVPYDPDWPLQFAQEAKLWKSILSDTEYQIHHVGSTSVPGLSAKPIIDMLLEVDDLALLDVQSKEIEELGYGIKGEYGIPGRRYFRKGKLQRTHHVHAYQTGDSNIARHLAFRDYLITHPVVAQEYATLKRQIAEWVGNDRRAYSAAKNDFIQEQELRALEWWGNRAQDSL